MIPVLQKVSILPSKKVAGKDFIRPVLNFFILPSAFVAGHREVFFQSRINDFAIQKSCWQRFHPACVQFLHFALSFCGRPS
jgi:hypothetical protein